MNLKERYEAARAAAKLILDGAEAAGRKELLPSEQEALEPLLKEAETLREKLKRAEESAELSARINALAGPAMTPQEREQREVKDGSGVLLGMGGAGLKADPFVPHPWATAVIQGGVKDGTGVPFGLPSGAVLLPPLSTIVDIPRAGGQLVAEIGLTGWPSQGGRVVQFLQQNKRDEGADVWRRSTGSAGADVAKPLSDYGWQAVEAQAEYVAHTSKVRQEDIRDFVNLSGWLQSEMVAGVLQALEAAILHGTAADHTGDGSIEGILERSDTLPQSFSSDPVITIRKALTQLQDAGYAGNDIVVCLSTADSEEIDLMRDDLHRYLGDGPFASGPNTLWSRRRIVCPQLETGTAIVGLIRGNAIIWEREIAQAVYGTVDDEFVKNLLSIRVEGRYAFGIQRPGAVVVCDLSAS
jgi:hypothetical protein